MGLREQQRRGITPERHQTEQVRQHDANQRPAELGDHRGAQQPQIATHQTQ